MSAEENPHSDDCYVSTERARLNHGWIQDTLLGTGWGSTWTHDMIHEAVRNSQVVFGLYLHRVPSDGAAPFVADRQIGFARVVTDYATIAYIADVVIDPEYRGRKLGKFLVAQIVAHPAVAKVPTLLRTKDAGPLYEKFGFVPVTAMRRMPLKEAP